jgi:hypothetical protein
VPRRAGNVTKLFPQAVFPHARLAGGNSDMDTTHGIYFRSDFLATRWKPFATINSPEPIPAPTRPRCIVPTGTYLFPQRSHRRVSVGNEGDSGGSSWVVVQKSTGSSTSPEDQCDTDLHIRCVEAFKHYENRMPVSSHSIVLCTPSVSGCSRSSCAEHVWTRE